MAKKIFIYDTFGVGFFICDFEGLDEDGKPRLTIMTPGCPVQNFREYTKTYAEEELDYHLLCVEGQPADSKYVIEMLGQIFINSGHPYDSLSVRLEEMRKYGISYDQELQKLTIRILEYEDEETKSVKYRMLMYVGELEHYVGEREDMYDSLKDICSKLTGFFFFIENQTHIPLKKHLISLMPVRTVPILISAGSWSWGLIQRIRKGSAKSFPKPMHFSPCFRTAMEVNRSQHCQWE